MPKNHPQISLIYPCHSKTVGTNKFQRFGIYAGAGKIPERPHIGLGYLSEALTQAGINHDLYDLNLLDYDQLKKSLRLSKPEIIGLTLVTPGYKTSYLLIKQLKIDFPKTKIVVGGPHVGIFSQQILNDLPEIDVGFISEAESNLISYLKSPKTLKNIPGIVFRENRRVKINPPILTDDIDHLGFPKYEKFDLNRYSGIGLYTSRGCPYQCIFCTVDSYRRKKFRGRSVDSIIEEITYWYQSGQRLFPIEDDNFTFDSKRIYQLCDALEELNLKDLRFALGQGVRADRVDRKLLRRMYQVGFRYITIAVEGGNNKVLRSLKKGENMTKIKSAIKNACEIGYEVRLLFVVGAPGETWKDVQDSLNLAQKYPILYSRFNNLIPIPGTELFKYVEKGNLFLVPPEEYLNSQNLDYTDPFYETTELNRKQRRQAIILSDQINQTLFYRYLLKKLSILSIVKYPIAYISSRKIIQTIISKNPFLYHLALNFRSRI
jgi:anaerobic magnesium-protoporphyrin IX monomethyl ester cyclase